MTNEQLVKEYLTLLDEEKMLAETKKGLQAKIHERINSGEILERDGVSIVLEDVNKLEYLDESAIIRWCKENGLSNMVKETIVSSALNKEINKGLSVSAALKEYYVRNEEKRVKVKAAK